MDHILLKRRALFFYKSKYLFCNYLKNLEYFLTVILNVS